MMYVYPVYMYSVLQLKAKDEASAVYDVVAVMDPLTRAAQKYSAIIAVSFRQTF